MEKIEEYKKDGLSLELIKKYILNDFKLRGEMPSFGNFILEKITTNI